MAYSEDIKKVFRQAGELRPSHELHLIDGNRLVISGHRGLLRISSEEILLGIKSGRIRVYGSDLQLTQASPDEIYLTGAIDGVEYGE